MNIKNICYVDLRTSQIKHISSLDIPHVSNLSESIIDDIDDQIKEKSPESILLSFQFQKKTIRPDIYYRYQLKESDKEEEYSEPIEKRYDFTPYFKDFAQNDFEEEIEDAEEQPDIEQLYDFSLPILKSKANHKAKVDISIKEIDDEIHNYLHNKSNTSKYKSDIDSEIQRQLQIDQQKLEKNRNEKTFVFDIDKEIDNRMMSFHFNDNSPSNEFPFSEYNLTIRQKEYLNELMDKGYSVEYLEEKLDMIIQNRGSRSITMELKKMAEV